MTTFILYAGYLFWSALVFFGIRSGLSQGKERVAALAEWLKDKLPFSLALPGGALFVLGLVFVHLQAAHIEEQMGLIGPRFTVGMMLGVLGAGLLSLQLFSDD